MNQLIKTLAHPLSFLRRNLKSILCIFGGSILLLFALYLFFHTPDRQFERLLDAYLTEELSCDGLTLHYMLARPEDYAIKNASHTFSVYQTDSFDASAREIERLLTLLTKTDLQTLSPTNRLTYNIFHSYLKQEQAGDAFRYYEEPLTFSSGMHVQLPILLSEYSLRSEEDILHYLTLLSSLPDYLDGILLYEQEKAANGLFMSRYALREVLVQCRDVITAESLKDNTHLLQVTFASRLDTLLKEGKITAEAYASYLQRNNAILKDSILPAYAALTNGLLALQDSATDSAGVCANAQGKEYYQYLVSAQTGSDKSIEELMDALKSSFLADYENLESLFPLPKEADSFSLNGLQTAQIMQELKEKTAILFPMDEKEGSLRVLSVEPSLEPYVSPAFYLTPPLDAYEENVIYINEGDEPDDLTLYTTLAHEGYPGHLFQTTSFYQEIEDGTYHPARALLHYPGYTEGYATYAEFLSYDYAKSHGDSTYIEAMCLNRRLHLALYSMLDICIHYYGYDNEDTYECLAAFGIEDRQAAGEIYEYIVNSPANYLSYFVGYLEVLECRELAEACWKDAYSVQNFHRFFLAIGPAPFTLIKEQIRAVDPDLITDKGY